MDTGKTHLRRMGKYSKEPALPVSLPGLSSVCVSSHSSLHHLETVPPGLAHALVWLGFLIEGMAEKWGKEVISSPFAKSLCP